MRHKVLKAISLCLVATWIVALLGACGGGGEGKSPSGTAADNKEPVELTFYRPHTGTTLEQFMDLAGNAIQAKFPHVTVKFVPFGEGTGMEDVLATGQNIDIVLLSIGFVPEYVKYNLQYDHNDLIKKYNFDLNRLEQTTVDFIKRFGDGKMYALPIFTTAEVLMYNKDLFDKFGVPYPKAGMTWDETFDLAKKMTRTEGGVQYYGFGMSVGHMLRVNQLSLPFVDPATGQPAIANDAFRKLLENFARFYTLPGASALLKNTANFFTKDKTLAMYAYFNSTMVSAPPEMNVDAVPLPSFPEARGTGSQMYPTYAGVSSISKHKDAAFQVLAYLTSEEMQTEFAKDGTGLPVVKNPGIIEVFGQNLPHLKGKNIKAFYPEKPAPIAPKTLYDDLAEKRAGEAFNQVAQNQKDAVTALREAAENASKDIEAAKGK
jgi:multiple sugar transport system substrate-binding protein